MGAILLIVFGALGLAYGAIGFGRETHHASVGPMEVSISEQRTVNIPVWPAWEPSWSGLSSSFL